MTTKAQDFSDFQALLEQLDGQQREAFLNLLHEMDTDELLRLFAENDLLGDLQELLDGENPIANLDDLLGDWQNAREVLLSALADTDFNLDDENALLEEFDRILGIWLTNNTDLAGVFDSLPGEIVLENPIGVGGINLDPLIENLNETWDTIDPQGLGNFAAVFGELFSNELFTDLELAFGFKEGLVQFYTYNYSPNPNDIKVIRIGSVPNFNSLWEARWHAAASYTQTEYAEVVDGEIFGQKGNTTFNPFILEGDFAIMYNPNIGNLAGGNVGVKLLTSLGMEVASYAPAHLDTRDELTWENVGNTTAGGPQIGTGLAFSTGPITTYTTATIAYGMVNNSPNYNYNSRKLEAGVRYGDVVNIRYTHGKQSWAPGNVKEVNTTHQFTIGILLASLFN